MVCTMGTMPPQKNSWDTLHGGLQLVVPTVPICMQLAMHVGKHSGEELQEVDALPWARARAIHSRIHASCLPTSLFWGHLFWAPQIHTHSLQGML